MSIQSSPLWPRGKDALILRAVLCDGEEAVAAWQSWREGLDYPGLDFAQRRLVPLLYERLRAWNVADPLLVHFRNDTRVFWAKNQQLFKFAADEVGRLEQLGVRPLVLKGVPLAVLYYAATGLRPMSDVDLLVRPQEAERCIEHYLGRGWTCSDDFVFSLDNLEQIIAVRNGLNLREPGSGREIDLHWRLLKSGLADLEPMWTAAREFPLNGRALRTLCATDLLLHAFAQAADWNVVRPIRWLPDATMIMARERIDWDRLIEEAQRLEIVETTRDALWVLQEFLGREIPDGALDRLRAIRTSLLSRMNYRAASGEPLALVGRPLLRYLRYLRIGRPQGLRFDQYLRYMWGIGSLPRAIAQGVRLVWKDLFDRPPK